MENRKIILLLILSIFIIGMVLAPASASHTFKKGKYKVTVSDNTYKKIKQGKKGLTKKVGYKKVTEWTTKKVKTYESWVDNDGNLIKSKSWNPYNKVGYKAKYVKSVWKYYNDGDICWEYYKVPKTVKKPLYLHAFGIFTGDLEHPHFTGKCNVWLDTCKFIAM
jgi:hypothetical protein